MSKVKTDAIETRAGGTSVLTIGTATQTIKLPGGTPGLNKVLKSDATGEASWGYRCWWVNGTCGSGRIDF